MKQKLLGILLLFSVIGVANAQKIKTKEIDKFTKQEVIETSTETLYKKNFMLSGWCNRFECCIRKVNDNYTMPTNILMDDIVKYDENSGITLLLSNNEAIILTTLYTGVGAEKYANGYWFNTSFSLSPSDIEKLKSNDVTSIRVSYMGGNFDRDLKGKKQKVITKMLKLVDGVK